MYLVRRRQGPTKKFPDNVIETCGGVERLNGKGRFEGLTLESILIAFAMIGIVIVGVYLASKRPKGSRGFPSRKVISPGNPSPSGPAIQVPSRLSAWEMLSRLQLLRGKNAQWDEIWSVLNPTDDPEVQGLLTEIRGPHLFVPHLGLSVMEDGCKRVLSVSSKVDALAALREAIRSQDPFVR